MSAPETTNPRWTVSDPEFQADGVVPLNPVYPWAGHRNFAYDLVRWMKPGRIVELGVHWGTSFFAFAQAIKDERLPTELVGVDTFKGDEHAGLYGDEVLTAVQSVIDRYFEGRSIVLHRMLFTEALGKVADGSADLIHIDGLHTHEAARFDYLSWLPKLAPGGIMLFHDTAPGTGYGSANFWKELSSQTPSIAFEHSWGLGVLFPKGDARLIALRTQNLDDKIALYTWKAEFRLAELKVRDLTRMSEQRYATIQEQQRLVEQRDRELAAHAERLREHRAWLADVRKGLDAARALGADRDSLARRLQGAETMCRERYDKIQGLQRDLDAAARRSAEISRHLDTVNGALERRTAEAIALERKLKEQQAMNDELKARVERLETDLELLGVRTGHVEEVLAEQRARLGALMKTRAGRRAAANLAALATPIVISSNGAAAGGARG